MFNLFKKKSEVQKMQEKYERLLKEGYDLSTSNRKESYLKIAEAQNLLEEIEKLSGKTEK
jgi:glutamyl-tRNA reductase